MLNEGMPIINRLGPGMAQQNALLNTAVRHQLKHVQGELAHYLGEERMPHEWGSLDSLDDMRNSMAVATALMDELLWCNPDNQQDYLRRTIASRGACCCPDEVLELAWPGQVEDDTWMEELDKYEE